MTTFSLRRALAAFCFASILLVLPATLLQTLAQEAPLQPGEAFVTRFGGTVTAPAPGGNPVVTLDLNGTVGSIIDLRQPGAPPRGEHWIDEPQRKPVTASQVGQVFGVAIDDEAAPNIYLAATSAFGLHRTADNAQWLPGLWGQGGGPGTIYRLDAATGYAPRIFTNVTLNGRANGGPALGDLAYDKWHKQLFVSDLETGMIHRLRTSDAADLGVFDHGVQGRANFNDVTSGQRRQLQAIPFDPSSRPHIADCAAGKFELTPACWNFAASGRRVWGLAVHADPFGQSVRLYYAVWSGPAFGQQAWNQAADDDKRNAVWSVRLTQDGNFDLSDVRREFLLPDFFSKPEDIARAGYSQPVSDIKFAECGERPIMLLAERGGIRNLGLAAENPFATPHEARALRYELGQNGAWQPVGRYDVGFYDRKNEGPPYIRANCSGGVAFGLGYNTNTWIADPAKPDQYVWMTGDALCSPEGPCNLPGAEQNQAGAPAPSGEQAQPASATAEGQPDDSQVHGVQGLAENLFEEILPASATAPYPATGNASPGAGLDQSYLIDTDINVDATGALIEKELMENDTTKIGAIAIYQVCARPLDYRPPQTFLLPPPPPFPGWLPLHFRFGSHNPVLSHNRFHSHNTFWSHSRIGSHNPAWSHNRFGSHSRTLSHNQRASHARASSHWRIGSHNTRLSHNRFGSHNAAQSHARTGSHNARLSHSRLGSHSLQLSHSRLGSHTASLSHSRTGSHNVRLSHSRTGSHSTAASRGGHSPNLSHSRAASRTLGHRPVGSHSTQASRGTKHSVAASRGTRHSVAASRGTRHSVAASRGTRHSVAASRGTIRHHSTVASRGTTRHHSTAASKGTRKQHDTRISRQQIR